MSLLKLENIGIKWMRTVMCTVFLAASPYGLGQAQNMGLFLHLPETYPGNTLFTPRQYTETFLVNMEGRLVHKWTSPIRIENGKLLENGLLLRSANLMDPSFSRVPGAHGRIELVDWDSSVVWTYDNEDLNADPLTVVKSGLHHDMLYLPTGNFLLSSFEAFSQSQAEAQGRIPNSVNSSDPRLIAERIIEVQPNKDGEGNNLQGGKIVWQWRVWNHLMQDHDNSKANYVNDLLDEPGRLNINEYRSSSPNNIRPRFSDWNHVSGLDYHAGLNQVMITLHGNDEVVIIDHSTSLTEAASDSGGTWGKGGEILYRTGNPGAYGAPGPRRYDTLHNAHWIADGLPDAGKVLILNNRRNAGFSIIEMFEIPTNEDGSYTIPIESDDPANAVITPVWSNGFQTNNMGGAQRLPNGNTLCDDAVHGRFLEITPDREVVWEYVNPVADNGPLIQGSNIPSNRFSEDQLNECFRAERIPLDYPGLADRDLTPLRVLEISTQDASELEFQFTVEQLPENPESPLLIKLEWPEAGDAFWYVATSSDLLNWQRTDQAAYFDAGTKTLLLDLKTLNPPRFIRMEKSSP